MSAGPGLGYQARFRADGVDHYLGHWATTEEAGIARDRAVIYLGLALPLHLPEASRAAGPASPAALRREARERSKARLVEQARRSSRYFGVAWSAQKQKWSVLVSRPGTGDQMYIAIFATEAEAAAAYDRVALHLLGDGVMLNFPERHPVPATVEQVRREARARTKEKFTCPYPGVSRASATGKWMAQFRNGHDRISLGVFHDPQEAARAVDRATLWLRGPDAELNFPELGAAATSPDVIRRDHRVEVKRSMTSPYWGVTWDASQERWSASFIANGKNVFLGSFDDEEQAALTVDRVALHLGRPRDSLNFPGRDTAPSSPDEIRAENWARFKEDKTSQYVGVSWSEKSKKWLVQITVDHHKITVGVFDDEMEAARAYDRAAMRLRGLEGRFNFVSVAGSDAARGAPSRHSTAPPPG